jgi:hypothetical protein
MKRYLLFFSLITLGLATAAQKEMKLNDSLKASAESFPVKMRGGSMLKYDFGVYKTIKAKPGLEKSTTKSKLFSAMEETESKQKASIVMTGNGNDTVITNISINVKSKEVREHVISISKGRVAWEKEEDPSTVQQNRNLVAVITTNRDTMTWNLIYIAQLNTQGSQTSNTSCVLTDGNKTIEIRNVTVWDNGKSPTFYSTIGFEFYSDGIAIGAVQNPADTFQKKFVWLQKDLDEKMKLILAGAFSALLSFTAQMPS